MVGIPENIDNDHLEDEVIEIMKEAKVSVNRQPLKKSDICAVHRIGKKGTTIVRVVNRKYSRNAIISGRNLRGSKRYGDDTRLFVNENFIPEFRFTNYVVRKAFREKIIHKYKIRNGVTHVQKDPDGSFVEIGHVLDLENLGITVPARNQPSS